MSIFNHADSPQIRAPIIVPNPDPSVATSEKIHHDLEGLYDQLQERIDGIKLTFEARLNAIDKASELFDTNLNRIPTQTDREVGNLRALHNERFASIEGKLEERLTLYLEKFSGIQRQFMERDTRVEQTARDTKVAVDAALQAAEKAVGKQQDANSLSITKSETATMKQIDSLAVTAQASAAALDSKLGDLKERLTRLESQAIGGAYAEAKAVTAATSMHNSNYIMVSIVSAVIAAISVVIAAITVWTPHVASTVAR